MHFGRALSLTITLASVMLVLLVVLIVGWVLLAVMGALGDEKSAAFYWTWLLIGTTFLTLVIVGVVMYLVLQIKTLALNARQTNFIDSVTHELKSPIASLKLYLQTLTRHPVSEEQKADFYRYMLDDVERLDQLTNHMLEVARVERGSARSDITEIRLDELLRQCGETVAMRYRVPLETVVVESPVCVMLGSRVDLEMIFRNLIDNAVKYGGAVPKVRVSLKLLPEARALISVADNGRGIPQKLRRKIFGRFVRLGVELEREKTGTGLGLYIVRTLVRRHGGQIRVVDPPDGVGTVFEVELPGTRGEERIPPLATALEVEHATAPTN